MKGRACAAFAFEGLELLCAVFVRLSKHSWLEKRMDIAPITF
jgi:hypothetical protein